LGTSEIKLAGMEMSLSSHDEALDLIKHRISPFLAKEKPDFMMLPEKWVMQRYEAEGTQLNNVLDLFSELSQENGCTIIPGSFSIVRKDKLYNSSPVISEGKILGWSDKISLYMTEKNEFTSGRSINVFQSAGVKFSVPVCYDLDFPYYTKVAIRKGARLLLNPSLIRASFHSMWHIYVTGRSLENRIPILSVNSSSPPLGGGSIGTFLDEEEKGVRIRKMKAAKSVISYKVDMESTSSMIERRMNEDPGIYSFTNE